MKSPSFAVLLLKNWKETPEFKSLRQAIRIHHINQKPDQDLARTGFRSFFRRVLSLFSSTFSYQENSQITRAFKSAKIPNKEIQEHDTNTFFLSFFFFLEIKIVKKFYINYK